MNYSSALLCRFCQENYPLRGKSICADCIELLTCERCNIRFRTADELDAHKEYSSHHHLCFSCCIDYPTRKALREHWSKSRYHYYCIFCDEHMEDGDDLKSHSDQYHCLCAQCKKLYRNETGLKEHYRQSPVHVICELCDEGFKDGNELHKHYQQSSARHFYCARCKIHYASKQNLIAHLNSSVHVPKTIPCPLKNCSKAFTAKAALILHFESGSCGSGMNKATVDLIRQSDKTHPVRSKPQISSRVDRIGRIIG